jgi:Spy/CpxP family protein refolding chaperone
MKRYVTVIAALMLLTSVAVRAEGDKPKHQGGGPGGTHMMGESLLPPMLVEKLNLTADQKAKYDELSAAFKKDVEQFRADHPVTDADKEAMKKARESGDKDAMKKFMETRKPLMEKRQAYMEQFKGTLTDEQKKTLDEARAKMMGGHGGHGERHGAAPGGAQPPKE